MGNRPHQQGRHQQGGRPQQHPVIAEDVVTLNEKVFFPLEEYPGYNFMGKLLGPKGSTLKGLVLSTKTKISILGKGSSKDKSKEEELAKSEEPEHAHFKEKLHVLIQVKAPKISAHRRMSQALKSLNYYMVPHRDERQEDELPPMQEQESMRGMRQERPAPMLRVGVPPPGAVLLRDDPPPRREVRREPPRDPYAPDYYEGRPPVDRYDDAPPQRGEPRGYSEEHDPYRRVEKRSMPPANGYSPKRYHDEYDPYAR